MHMAVSGKAISIGTYLVVIGLGIVAVFYLTGSNVQPVVELSVKEFEWKNQPIQITLRFVSDDGAFTTGKIVHVHGLLFYPTKTNPDEKISLYLPNTLTPDEYNTLSNDKQWEVFAGGGVLKMTSALSKHYEDFTGITPTTTFDAVWIQEGLQDGYVIIRDSSNATNLVKIPIDKMINIQSADVLQNLRTTNIIAGLTFALIAITITVSFAPYDRFKIPLKDGCNS